MEAKEEKEVQKSIKAMFSRMPENGCSCPHCIAEWKNRLTMKLAALKTKTQTKATIKRINEIQEKLDYLASEDKKQEDYLAKVSCKPKNKKSR